MLRNYLNIIQIVQTLVNIAYSMHGCQEKAINFFQKQSTVGDQQNSHQQLAVSEFATGRSLLQERKIV